MDMTDGESLKDLDWLFQLLYFGYILCHTSKVVTGPAVRQEHLESCIHASASALVASTVICTRRWLATRVGLDKISHLQPTHPQPTWAVIGPKIMSTSSSATGSVVKSSLAWLYWNLRTWRALMILGNSRFKGPMGHSQRWDGTVLETRAGIETGTGPLGRVWALCTILHRRSDGMRVRLESDPWILGAD